MRVSKQLFILIIFIFFANAVHAETNYRRQFLTLEEIHRVRVIKELLGGVDKQSVTETINELERSRHPELNLQMKEAMARAYTDIVREIGVDGQKKREWLYSMVCLNMAYFQFGGSQGNSRNTSDLNRLIRQKLIEYLPSNVSKQPGFIYSLE